MLTSTEVQSSKIISAVINSLQNCNQRGLKKCNDLRPREGRTPRKIVWDVRYPVSGLPYNKFLGSDRCKSLSVKGFCLIDNDKKVAS